MAQLTGRSASSSSTPANRRRRRILFLRLKAVAAQITFTRCSGDKTTIYGFAMESSAFSLLVGSAENAPSAVGIAVNLAGRRGLLLLLPLFSPPSKRQHVLGTTRPIPRILKDLSAATTTDSAAAPRHCHIPRSRCRYQLHLQHHPRHLRHGDGTQTWSSPTPSSAATAVPTSFQTATSSGRRAAMKPHNAGASMRPVAAHPPERAPDVGGRGLRGLGLRNGHGERRLSLGEARGDGSLAGLERREGLGGGCVHGG
uniref:Uncharacterized protein n=1 Tax=Oryza glaberrima TaxID=4538 RepID=I1QAB8_ORYGL